MLSQFGVSGFPTLMFLTKEGKGVRTIVGGLPLAALLQAMDSAKAAARLTLRRSFQQGAPCFRAGRACFSVERSCAALRPKAPISAR